MRGRNVVAREGGVHQTDLELGGLRICVEGTVIGQRVHAHAEDLSVLAQRQFTLQIHIATEAGGDQVAGLVFHPLNRTLGEDRREDRNDVSGVDRHLVAESTTEVGSNDANHVLRKLGHHGHRGAHDVRSLRGHVHRELAGRTIEISDRAAGLKWRRVRARVVQLGGRDDVGFCESAVCGRLVADLPVEDLVRGLILFVVANQRHVRILCLVRVHDRGKLFVFHHDLLRCVFRDVGIIGDDGSHFLALEAHLVRGQHRLGVIGQRGHPREVARRHHVAGEHQAHARNFPGRARINRLDSCVRHRAAQNLHVQHAGQHDVVDVAALATNEAVVLDTAAARAHAANLQFIKRCHLRLLVLSAHLVCGPQDGLHDVLVPGATAEVAGKCPAHVVLGGIGIALEECFRREHHAGGAKTTLQTVLLLEAFLNGMQFTGGSHAFNGFHFVTVGLNGEHGAALDGATIEQHGARTAVGRVATGVCSGELQTLAKQVGEQQTGLHVHRSLVTVDRHRDASSGHTFNRCGYFVVQTRHGQAAFCSELAMLFRIRVTNVFTMWRLYSEEPR